MRRVFPLICITIPVILIYSSYSNTFHSPPILDDYHSFILPQSLSIKEWSISSLVLLSKTMFGWARWIPMISFSFDHRIGNGSIVPFHLTNTVIHALCLLAVILLVFNLLQVGEKMTLRPKESPIPCLPLSLQACGRFIRFKPMR